MSTTPYATSSPTWVERLAPLGAIIFATLLVIAFFTSDDYGDTPQSVVAYADGDKTNIWLTAILGLSAPLLLGLFVAGLVGRLGVADPMFRALMVIGGSVAIALLAVGMTIWSAPLLDDNFDETGAATYLALDDFGWVIIGTGGVGMGLMIIGASLAAMQLRLLPSWLGWVSVALGVVAFASVAAIGLFAWLVWLIVAAVLMLVRPRRPAAPVTA